MRTLLALVCAVLLGVTFAGSSSAAVPSMTATLLGQTGEDLVGTFTQAPDGIKDVHVRLTGVSSPLTSVKVTGADGIGNWQTPKHANWWLVAIMPQTDPSIVDLYFDPRSPESAYTITVNNGGGKQTLLTGTSPPPPTVSMWALTLSTFGSGTGTTTGAGVYANGTVVTPGETPAAGSMFNGWLGSGTCTTGTVTMTANTTCTAAFTLIQWTLTITTAGTGSGATTGAGTYVNGTVVTMTAAPATGSTFAGWTGTGCTTGTVTMTANVGCTAVFTLIVSPPPPTQWTLTITTAGTGSGATTGAGTYVNGTVVTMTAVPATGSTFAGWTGTGCTTGTVTMMANTTCTATFTLIPPPPAGPVSSVPIPSLAQWEANMVNFGKIHCSTITTGTDQYGNVQTEDMLLAMTYYDGIEVMGRIAKYTNDPTWTTCQQAEKLHYRDRYVIPNNGATPGYWNFTTGLTEDFLTSGDSTSKNAEILISQNAAYAQDWVPLTSTVDPSLSREVTYAIRSYINAEKLGQPRRARLAALVTQELGYVDQWFISKTYRCPTVATCNTYAVGQYYIQPFMVGLTMEGLIMAYEATGDTRIPPAIKVCLDWLWANAWVPANQSWWYENWVTDPSVPFPPRAGAPDLNLLMAPAYAWYYKFSGNTTYRDEGDQAFAGAVAGAYLGGAKQFNQNYSYGFDYVTRRTGN